MREFIPTTIRCIGNMDEVWTLADDILCPILQSVLDTVYKGKIPCTVVADGPVIALIHYFFRHYLNLTFF